MTSLPADDTAPATPVASPLSRGQRAMWFLWNMNPAGAEYGLPMAWTIDTPLDPDALRDALQALVDRHPVLRTTYSAPHGEPVQLVHARLPVSFERVDASDWDDARLHARLSATAHAPFDLAHGPIFRCHLFTRAASAGKHAHVLLFNSHHIATDTWSLIVLMEELGLLYRAAVGGHAPELPPDTLAYTAYVGWQQDLLASSRADEHWTYWRSQLAAPPSLDLPTDRPRPTVQTHAGAGHAFTLDKELTAQIRALARQEDVTFYTVLLAAFYVLLYRYTGQDDIVVGSPRFGRPPEGYARTVGYFASPCALRCQLDGASTFSELLHGVRKVLVGSREHQDFPFPLLVEKLGLPRDLSRSPVFQVAFTYQKSQLAHLQGVAAARMGLAGASLDLSGLRLDSYPLEQHTVKFDLDFVVEEVDESLRAVCWYNTDLWNADSIAYLVEHYQALLQSAAQAPDQAVERLPMLTEREQLASAAWNATATPYSQACAHQLFEQQVARAPEAEALRYGGRSMRYDELNRRANQLARYLQRQGLEPGQLVGLSMERGQAELVIGVLAILKAGAAYLPLDPAYPQDRLAFMLDDASLRLLLTQDSLQAVLPASAARQVCLDRDWDSIAQEASHDLDLDIGPAELAYVIYTSGSTGRPKGVLLEHRGLSNLVHALMDGFAVGPASRMLQFASSSFDASVSEIFTALGAGASLCLAPKLDLIPGSALVNTINDNAISVVTLPPSVLALLRPADVPGLHTIITAGEACSLELARRWSDGRRMINAYGPTEASVCATMARMHPLVESVSIGGPLPNTRVHVLDAHLQPVPIGVAGELHIAGTGLARGYLNRPELTRERFITAPCGERLYKTGDLVRREADGGLKFLGRLDHQVKIRGFRIELGELEAVIGEWPGIREALVLARGCPGGDQALVAYAIAHEGAVVTPAALRAHVQSRLPDFMVPADFVLLDAWPSTPNGKIDRRALPAPPEHRVEATAAMPRDELERQIAAIWCEVLAVSAVSIDDSFFDAGGHSLSLVQVEVLLEEQLGIVVATVDLFRFPTIRLLARHLRTTQGVGAGDKAVPVEPAAPRAARTRGASQDIAIVGMAGKFPGANDIDAFWRNLCAGVESVTELSDQQLQDAGVDPALHGQPRYVRRKGTLDGVECFDAPFFGYPPREALLMDPQQRQFLEVAWQALEHAGYGGGATAGRVGVYGGTGRAAYMLHFLSTNPASAAELFQTTILNDKDFLSTRVAYKLDLRGPALAVQTACSTSLVALHLACQQLLQDDCDLALAGGVSIEVPHGAGYLYQEGHILSPDGRCRAFDAGASGTVRGSGGALVALKRLADATADGDTIWAVIKGSAINNDGGAKVGYTAPAVEGQAAVIEQALQRAGVDPRTIGLVEAHGTATPLGDPIEVAALTQAYRRHTPDKGFCLLGSVKTNVGHLDAAAGVTGLIKAALAVYHGQVPATLHFQSPNPKLGLEQTPFRVNPTLVAWPASASPRRAAVSSFGIGGTNAHVILEQASQPPSASGGLPAQLLNLSARSETALHALAANLASYLAAHPEANLADVAYTLQLGRAELPLRRSLACTSVAQAREMLARPACAAAAPGAKPRVSFMFPGQGLQKVNMGRELYAEAPQFRACVDDCARILQPLLDCDLRTLLYPEPDLLQAATLRLAQTAITQPALFVVEYALARQLMHWGVQPDAMIGHSLGEYVAACLAGVLSLGDALTLVAARGRLVQQLPAGAMLAVEADPEQLLPFVGGEISLAVVNGPQACVLAGPVPAVDAIEPLVAAAGLRCKRIPTSHAFHSSMLDPVLAQFQALVEEVQLHAPRIPYITNVTGTWVTAQQATSPQHWVRHLRQTVLFAPGLARLLEAPDGIFLEVGPGQTFSAILRRHPLRHHVRHAGPTLATSAEPSDCAALLHGVGQVWAGHGAEPAWDRLHLGVARRRIGLPVYPFDRHRYWPAAPTSSAATAATATHGVQAAPGMPAVPMRLDPPAPAPAADSAERQVCAIFEEVLGIDAVAPADNFFDLGGSSLSTLSVVIRLEQVFGSSLPSALLLENPTPGGLARALRSGQPARSARLVGLRSTGTRPPIFCVHPYGGHTTGYVELVRALGLEQPVFGIQARGLQGESEPLRTIEAMAADYIGLIKAQQPAGPYQLAGHSMGGCIAFEMAQQLQRGGDQVSMLALIDSRAHNASLRPLYRNSAYGQMARKDWLSDDAVMLGILFPKLAMDWEALRSTPADEHWVQVQGAAMRQGLLPAGTAPEGVRQLLAVTQANDEALRSYQPQPWNGPLLLFAGTEGFGPQFNEPELGWRELAPGTLEVLAVPGDHHGVMVGASAQAIARRLLGSKTADAAQPHARVGVHD
ncbi:non-ribosomal peptide synthetase/type I polyketide synthase [Massilia sp. H6]|uniref:non-ribosomal peptide synthetase/type I polyketide synthase n=1 Tax=Massilia sp. H6 TaxID=2970464 RepID=UPI0021671F69|nr:non-ribosomal peptide synthetase/type I polyketide synthase [Massilia sp. H6]UVW28153.1 amino acid adenylation domain-containing protein [Massilia sp. H6]